MYVRCGSTLSVKFNVINITVCYVVFLVYKNLIAPILCLFLEEFQHFLSCCENLYIGLHNELITVQLLLLAHVYFLYCIMSSSICKWWSSIFYLN